MRFKRVLATLLTPFMILLNCPVMAAQGSETQPAKSTTEIFHKPIESAKSGKRITLYTEVSDQNGIDVVRIYFKSKDGADFTFIALKQVDNQEKDLFEKFQNLGSDFKGQGYSGVLPAPAKGSKSFDYLVLVKNKANVIVKSQIYSVSVTDETETEGAAKEPVQVYTELTEFPKTVTGFADTITVDMAESGAKAGVVAGLYSGLSAGGGGAVSGGTVVASSGGFTTTAAVVGGAAAVVVVGGVAAAASGSDSSSGSSGGGQALNATTIVGVWNVNATYETCPTTGQLNLMAGGAYSYNMTYACSSGTKTRSGVGTWTLDGSTLTLTNSNGWVDRMSVNGNSEVMNSVNLATGETGTFTRAH